MVEFIKVMKYEHERNEIPIIDFLKIYLLLLINTFIKVIRYFLFQNGKIITIPAVSCVWATSDSWAICTPAKTLFCFVWP